jgi:hypothetical protein
MKISRYIILGCLSAAVLTLNGCGGGKDDALVAPPPPPAAPAVSMTATPEPAAAPVATTPEETAPPPPPTLEELAKKMTPQQLEDYKAGTTPETHDMNLGPLLEAVNGFKAEFRRYPTTQEEMVKARYLPKILHAPKGKKYVINSETGEITVQ